MLREGIFWTADLLEAANELVPLIRDRRPQVLITYNEIGGYGHPDHIQAHRVAMYGYQLAGVAAYRPDLGDAWPVDRVLWTTMSETRLREGIRALRDAGRHRDLRGLRPRGRAGPMAAPDEAIAVEIDGSPWVGAEAGRDAGARHPDHRRRAVLRRRRRSWATRCGRTSTTGSPPAPRSRADGWADDLFAGLNSRAVA